MGPWVVQDIRLVCVCVCAHLLVAVCSITMQLTQGMHELLAPVLFVMATEQREDIESDPTLS